MISPLKPPSGSQMQKIFKIPVEFPNRSKATRLSHSTLDLLHRCERLYQLKRLLRNVDAKSDDEGSEHLSFGHAFGAGVQTYLLTQDKEAALYAAWLAYWPQIETDKKNQPRVQALLAKAFIVLDSLLMEYEVEKLEDIERGFMISIEENYYYVGYIDAVLRNRFSGRYYVLECKSTGLMLENLSALYCNSGQALGYSIALDRIAGQPLDDFGVIYLVGQMMKTPIEDRIKVLPFEKTYRDRLNWFISLGMDVEHLQRMKELNVYPQRGDACLKYNKACPEFGTCGLTSLDFPYVESAEERQARELKEAGLPVYSLDELIELHLNRT